MLKLNGIDIAGKTVAVSGSGNVAIYATQKAHQLGAKVVTVSDSNGWVYDPDGIDVDTLKEIKEAVSYTHLNQAIEAESSQMQGNGRRGCPESGVCGYDRSGFLWEGCDAVCLLCAEAA